MDKHGSLNRKKEKKSEKICITSGQLLSYFTFDFNEIMWDYVLCDWHDTFYLLYFMTNIVKSFENL